MTDRRNVMAPSIRSPGHWTQARASPAHTNEERRSGSAHRSVRRKGDAFVNSPDMTTRHDDSTDAPAATTGEATDLGHATTGTELPPTFVPGEIEGELYRRWVDRGYFT